MLDNGRGSRIAERRPGTLASVFIVLVGLVFILVVGTLLIALGIRMTDWWLSVLS